VTDVHPRAGNSWLFRQYGWDNLTYVDRWRDSITTMERDAEEQEVVAWYRDHRRRPITEWSDLADPFEPAGIADWSPVRSVRLSTPGKPSSKKDTDADEYTRFLALRRQRRREALEAEPS
jgi:hypothetical protein